ncbi:hypothetical protein [Nocardia huaxiensis]|uniref:Uncharacterized protein n=1 Tax=Nocardia huaxiensis TaxID=2755382 RepID=A0A7D6ZQS3_9NOCA|nr:hypothetical protein [Nocardia huaxiensis]QLY31445.1 hypothetical protein H0264_03590 [Nocardia huaxiensis]UFS94994.1 hypothetical protein LPY97_30425 [Nocardia huaxiensis]
MTKARDKVLAAWKLGDGRVLADNPGYTTTEYGGPGPVLQFWAHNYSAPDAAVLKGHCMPGGTHASMLPLLPEFWAGTSCAPTGPEPVFSAGEVAMDFFLAHPRQP